MPPELKRLRTLLTRALTATATLFPDVQEAYTWVHHVAHLLSNPQHLPSRPLQQALTSLFETWSALSPATAFLQEALAHFQTITDHYGAHLFACYDLPDLPRTNNDLEHLFGSVRYHERRITGHKKATATAILRGAVRVVAALTTPPG